MASRFLSWLITENGKRCAGYFTVAATTSGVLMKWLPNSYMTDQFKELVQLYRDSFPVPVSPAVMNHFNQVVADTKLSAEDASKVKPFTVFGFDMFNAGSLTYRTESIVGIPVSFSYLSAQDINKKDILVGNKTVHWSSPDGISLESALLLSDSAKKFAIAREITLLSTHQVSIISALNGTAIFSCYFLAHAFNRKTNAFTKPRGYRIAFYTLLGSFMFTLWLFLKDFTVVNYEAYVDDKAGSINEEYARGASEYYTKILQRNIALRSLMGSDGEKLFTAYGNDQSLFRTNHLPYTARRDAAVLRLKKFSEVSQPNDL